MNNWTKEKPTENGWYWYRHNPGKYPDLPAEVSEPLLLMVYENGTYYQDTVNDLFGQKISAGMDGLWAGPIDPPPFGVGASAGD